MQVSIYICQDDQYEENDTRATATPLPEQTWITARQADNDFFVIDVTSGYERVLVDCRFTHAQGDIDIELQNSSGTVICSSGSTDDNEYIDCCVPGPGTYYIRVHYDNECNAYQLWWDDVSGCCDDQYEENDTRATATPLPEQTWITARQADNDFFVIDVTSGYER
ncbi:MAG: PPC domain-containing protein, partial [Candidatus Zixiibacteriota bacterium]